LIKKYCDNSTRKIRISNNFTLLSKNTTYNINSYIKLCGLTSRQHVSAATQPSSGQNRTQSGYIEGMHSVGSNIVDNNIKKAY